jgi:hypothetical protein
MPPTPKPTPPKCAWHPRRAAEHTLLGVAICDECARLALRTVVNQPDPSTLQPPPARAPGEPTTPADWKVERVGGPTQSPAELPGRPEGSLLEEPPEPRLPEPAPWEDDPPPGVDLAGETPADELPQPMELDQ